MKKHLLLILTVSFSVSLIAQSAFMTQKERLSKIKMTKVTPTDESKIDFTGEVAEYAGERGADVIIGATVYDLQSNSSMMQRTYLWPDGSISATWTRGMTVTGTYPDRGTGYNYYDGTAWGPAPTARIEPVRTGWPNIAPFMGEGELVCAHTGVDAGLIFSYRETKGTGSWTNFYLVGPPAHEDLLWPRMVTTGENHEIIHVIALTPPVANSGTEYEGLDGALLYSRSSDGGLTWDPKNVILDGVGSNYTNGWSGDTYIWAAPVGETIAFAAFDGVKDGVVMKSTDGGDTWERIPFYNSGTPFFDNSEVQTIYGGGDGYNAAAIDETGKVHVAFGRQLHAADGTGGPGNYYPYSNGLVYWNEDMAPLDSLKVGSDILDPVWLRDNGYLLAEVQENGDDTIVGIATYQASMTSFPQLIIKDNQLYAFYSSISLGFDNTVNNYRHVWGRVSELDGSWSEYTDYTGDVFHLFSECVFPGVSPTANDKIHLTYQTSNQPGINSRYEDHDPIDNNYVYLAVSPLHTGIGDNLSVPSFEVAQNQPNPAMDQTTIMVTTQQTGQIGLSLSNVLGQVVYQDSKESSTLGAQAFTVDVSGFDSGIYFYTVTIGNKSVTKKMMVK